MAGSVKPTDDDLIAALVALSPDGVARQRRDIVAMLSGRGWTFVEIAVAVGVTRSAVTNWVKR